MFVRHFTSLSIHLNLIVHVIVRSIDSAVRRVPSHPIVRGDVGFDDQFLSHQLFP